jgi:hypothetical protein
MRGKIVAADSAQGRGHYSRLRAALLERRRRYNRLYMRQWRADPTHEAREREHRQQWYHARKERDAREKPAPFTNERGESVCGFCRANPPIGQVLRLQICELAPKGYVEVRIPYCGEC